MPQILPFKRPRRWLSAGLLLTLLTVGSLGQYLVIGEVSWMTDSLRWVERIARPYADLDQIRGKVHGWLYHAERAAYNAMEAMADAETREPQSTGKARLTVPYDLVGVVVHVADGDTLTLLDNRQRQYRIRLHGIDAPETGQPYGNAAKDALDALVAGHTVGVQIWDTDRYGRTVGVVFIGQRNINLSMVKRGWAWWYERYAPHDTLLATAELDAREARRGLWHDPNPVAPWEWRHD